MSAVMKAKRHCFAPRCRSGYHGHKKISLFRVPKGKVAEWSALIPKSEKELTSIDTLCEKHFLKEDIIREVITATYSYRLNHPRLKENAVPCIWPDGVEAPEPTKRKKVSGSNEAQVFDNPLASQKPSASAGDDHFVFVECNENISIKDEPLIFEENSLNDELEPPSSTLQEDNDDDDERNLVIDESLIFEESEIVPRIEKDKDSVIRVSSYEPLLFEDCDGDIFIKDELSSDNNSLEESVSVQKSDENVLTNSRTNNQFWLNELFETLWERKTVTLRLPSESWTQKYYNNKIAIFKTSIFEDDILITKKVILCKSFVKFFILQHVHHCLTDKSNNRISCVEEFEKVLVKFDKLSICYGLSVKERVAIDFRKTWYRKDEILQSIRHKNCTFILNDKKRLYQSINWCGQCENAKKLVAYFKKKNAAADLVGATNPDNSRKRDRNKMSSGQEDENANKDTQKEKRIC